MPTLSALYGLDVRFQYADMKLNEEKQGKNLISFTIEICSSTLVLSDQG